ncbi:MAG: hypothetical protein V1913_06170 [Fibrobacterota bacterium]
MVQVMLKAPFWDYPEYADETRLKAAIEKSRNTPALEWFLSRLLEYGRAIDAMRFFTIAEIAENLTSLKLSGHVLEKWRRLVQVYG